MKTLASQNVPICLLLRIISAGWLLFQAPGPPLHTGGGPHATPSDPDTLGSSGARLEAPAPGRLSLRSLPLRFEANDGQAAPAVDFLARGGRYAMALTRRGAILQLARSAWRGRSVQEAVSGEMPKTVRMELIGADPTPRMTAGGELPGTTNYFIGNGPRNWRTNIKSYGRVAYHDVYPGIDLVYHGSRGDLEYDWIVAPGGDARSIQLAFDGIDGLSIDAAGDLVLALGNDAIRMRRPQVYQSRGGTRRAIAARYVLDESERIGVEIGDYDAEEPLVIDPILTFSTYLGGAGIENSFPDLIGGSIAVDGFGGVYVTGMTSSLDFPIVNALQVKVAGIDDVFVAKLNPTGTAFVYSTYIGGKARDIARRIEIDATGNAVVIGLTNSPDFPVSHPYQPELGGEFDAFILKLDPRGSELLYSSYFGGSDFDVAFCASLDASGNIFLGGRTRSTDFPTSKPLQESLRGPSDAWVAELKADGSELLFSTYFGSKDDDWCFGMAVDASGDVYLTGQAGPNDLKTTNAMQAKSGGDFDAFVAKFNPARSLVLYCTYLGGEFEDRGNSIAVDAQGNAYVTGFTGSEDFPVGNGAYQTRYAGNGDAFITQIGPSGSELLYSTYLGGSDEENVLLGKEPPADSYQGFGNISIDSSGKVHVSGSTFSSDFPLVRPLQTKLGGLNDIFVATFDAAMSKLVFSTYLGGSGYDTGNSASDTLGNVYLTGYTTSPDFPTTMNAPQATLNGSSDAFLARIQEADAEPKIEITMNKAEYANGDDVVVEDIRVRNPGKVSRVAEFKVWLSYPDLKTVSLLNLGSDGSVTIPGGFERTLGSESLTLFTVDRTTMRGTYVLGTRIADPVTLILINEHFKAFMIR